MAVNASKYLEGMNKLDLVILAFERMTYQSSYETSLHEALIKARALIDDAVVPKVT